MFLSLTKIVNNKSQFCKRNYNTTATKVNLLEESFPVKYLTDASGEKKTIKDLFENKKVVVFGVPGAFTPVCHSSHVPSYINNIQKLKEKGVDSIICVEELKTKETKIRFNSSVNDRFVLKAWGESLGVEGKISMISDWNGNFVKNIGKDIDLTGAGLGTRSKRFALVINNGVIEQEFVELTPAEFDVTSADNVITYLDSVQPSKE